MGIPTYLFLGGELCEVRHWVPLQHDVHSSVPLPLRFKDKIKCWDLKDKIRWCKPRDGIVGLWVECAIK